MHTRRSLRALLALGALLAATLAAACTPEQEAAVRAAIAEREAVAAADKFPNAMTPQQMARLRHCESRGNYSLTSRTGKFRGAYQFSRSSWDATARRHYPELVGKDPAGASVAEQDKMTRALWATGGRGHWPVCGRRV